MPNCARSQLPNLTLAPGIATGSVPDGWVPLARTRLLILVGVTGVGKSTTLRNIREQGLEFPLLPDRRALTDSLIIATIQAQDGVACAPVTDRAQRFAYTRRFREQYAGGMAHALSLLCVAPELQNEVLLFDGLRGENEIAHAAALPNAHFVMLDAPDIVRVMRLLGRKDGFDRIHPASTSDDPTNDGIVERSTDFFDKEARALFAASDLLDLQTLVTSGAVSAEEVLAKIKIVTEERRNYDPAATRRALEQYAGSRALILDTSTLTPRAVSQAIARQFARWFPMHGAAGGA